ncbi:hypothetical protein PM082_004543 [Marasmius tenuissimus]|nr:hypothetical protein PM082_004543 [Marasmius tenuissimus]
MASEQEIAKQAVEPYTSVEIMIVQPVATSLVMFLVYGMYIIIFGLSLNVLWHRIESSASRSYMRWIIALFILTTIYNAGTVWTLMDQTLDTFNAIKTNNYIPYFELLTGGSRPAKWAAREGLMLFSSAIISCIFDYLMVHRCYVIWSYNKWILYPFAFVVLATDVTGLAVFAIKTAAYQHQDHSLYNKSSSITMVLGIISTVYVSLLSLLTAGRIWWTVRQVGQITGGRVYSRYKIFVATTLESGLLYSVSQVVGALVPLITDPEAKGLGSFNFGVVSVQMAGIAQTVMIVRIAYGRAVESIQQTVSTLRFDEGTNNYQQRSTVARGAVDLRRSFAGVEERGTVRRIEMSDKPPLNMVGDAV